MWHDIGEEDVYTVHKADEVDKHGEPSIWVDGVFLPVSVHFVGLRHWEAVWGVDFGVESQSVGHVGCFFVEDVEHVLSGVVEACVGEAPGESGELGFII